jgi:cation diffusion facilitator family transporter
MREDDTDGEALGARFVWYVAMFSVFFNCILVGIKLGLSLHSGSLALRADGIHSFVDVMASVAIIAGLWIANRKSEEFPYGLYKVENVVSIIISLLIFLTAYEIVIEALSAEGTSIVFNGWVILVVASLIPVTYLFGRYQVHIGEKYRSPSLIADGKQHTVDVLSTIIVFFALVGQAYALPFDSIAAVLITLFIIRSGWQILAGGMRVLLDASIDPATLDAIRDLILSEPEVTRVIQVMGRNSGQYIFIEACIEVRLTNLERAHLVSQRIEQRIHDEVPPVDRVVIHYEPRKKTTLRYAFPVTDLEGSISTHFGEAPYFSLIDVNCIGHEIINQTIIQNQYRDAVQQKGILVARMLLEKKVDIIVTKESLSGKGPGYAFLEAGVELDQTDCTTTAAYIEQNILRSKNEKINVRGESLHPLSRRYK